MKRSAASHNNKQPKVRTPTYDKIRSLATQLQQDAKITVRRDVGKSLFQLLSKDEVRQRLAEEATQNARANQGDLSVAASRCHALAQLWKVILCGAITFAESIGHSKSKAKLNEEDINLPYNLLIQCDKPDEAFDSVGLGIEKLSKSTVRKLLIYCLKMLADENAVILAELKLLEMLHHLCSRVYHVGQFKLETDLPNVFDELSLRLETPSSSTEDSNSSSNNNKHTHSHGIVCAAAKALDGLLVSCKSLGIQVHNSGLLQETIHLVSSWCRRQIKADKVNPSSDIVPYLFNAVATALECHPEHAIGPMKRDGRNILSYARRCYPNARSVQKTSLSNYLLAHM
jgi:hypothetical protein